MTIPHKFAQTLLSKGIAASSPWARPVVIREDADGPLTVAFTLHDGSNAHVTVENIASSADQWAVANPNHEFAAVIDGEADLSSIGFIPFEVADEIAQIAAFGHIRY